LKAAAKNINIGGLKLKVCVSGLGRVGLPTALYVKDKGFEVWGYDINETAIQKANDAGIRATGNWRDIPFVNIYVVCVYTGLKNSNPDMSQVYDVCSKIREKKKPTFVSVESTVYPGTCRKIYNEIFGKEISLVHVPHRYWISDPVHHGVQQTRVIGAINEASLSAGLDFYGKNLKIPLHAVSSIEISELCKLVENAYRYVQIAYAEELNMICEGLGLNFNEVRAAANTKWNTEILEARTGIIGSCLPKDIRFLLSGSKLSELLKGAIEADQSYQAWLARRDGN
jgi:nucleotide sugar dehydrogenase